jgi:hypothetical protein
VGKAWGHKGARDCMSGDGYGEAKNCLQKTINKKKLET